jgi:hypothetical protein
MKKILAILSLAAITTGLQAQGLVVFSTFAGTLKTNMTQSIWSQGIGNNGGSASGNISGTANGFYFTVLIAASSPGTNYPGNLNWTPALYAGSTMIGTNYPAVAGDMQGPKGSGATAIDNWGSGATESFVIVGWSANLGTSWSTVSTEMANNWNGIAGYSAANDYFFGASTVGSGASGVPPLGTALQLFGTTGTFSMFQVAPVTVPEPATMALVGLGGLSLLLFRRRK